MAVQERIQNHVKHDFWLLTIFTKPSILDIWQGSEYCYAVDKQTVKGKCCSSSKNCLHTNRFINGLIVIIIVILLVFVYKLSGCGFESDCNWI